MAAAGAFNLNGLSKALLEKKEVVRRVVNHALHEIMGPTRNVGCTFSHSGNVYEIEWLPFAIFSSDLDVKWTRVLSEGLGTTFDVDWYRKEYPHTDLTTNDLRVLRLGEPIFNIFRSHGLFPEWTGTKEETFTITAVDDAGAKLAVAMALHDRLGSNSPLSLVSSLA